MPLLRSQGLLPADGVVVPAVAVLLRSQGLLPADGGALSVVGPDTPSSGLGEVSVYADDTMWAAAVSVRPNACFYPKP